MTGSTVRLGSVLLGMATVAQALIADPATRHVTSRPTTEPAVPALPPAGVPLFFYVTPQGWLIRIGHLQGAVTKINDLAEWLEHFMVMRNAHGRPGSGAEVIIFEKRPMPPELFDAIAKLGNDLGFEEVRRASKEEWEDHLYEEQTGVIRQRPRPTTKPK
jgi:hypothetical protein